MNESSFNSSIGDIIIELSSDVNIEEYKDFVIGETIQKESIIFGEESISINQAQAALEGTLDDVWSTKRRNNGKIIDIKEYRERTALDISEKLECSKKNNVERMSRKPVALIPVFPGTNSELDTKHALIKAGFEVKEFVFYTPKKSKDLEENKKEFEKFKQSRINFAKLLNDIDFLIFPGGFSGGDEPDGSAKFIVNIMKSEEINDSFQGFLNRKNSLTLGICNGFQALIKLGVFKDSEIKPELGDNDPTLTFNDSLKHETDIVKLRVASILSPLLSKVKLGDEFVVPISHSEGKLIISKEEYLEYLRNGQIPLQYLDPDGKPTDEYNGSYNGVAGLTSPDGRIFGMMPHPERTGVNVFKNIPGEKLLPIFESAFESLTGGVNEEIIDEAVG